MKNTTSNEKTTANETISREEKSRREKNRSIHPFSSRQSITRKLSEKDQLVCEMAKEKEKPKTAKCYPVD
jgi:hypothetical protein